MLQHPFFGFSLEEFKSKDGWFTMRLSMTRVKCKKCSAVFEQGMGAAVLAPHVGPLHYMKCPACGKRSWLNLYSSVKDTITWPMEEAKQKAPEPQLTEEELEAKRIEDSKYEKA
jgi:hypothetical protein